MASRVSYRMRSYCLVVLFSAVVMGSLLLLFRHCAAPRSHRAPLPRQGSLCRQSRLLANHSFLYERGVGRGGQPEQVLEDVLVMLAQERRMRVPPGHR